MLMYQVEETKLITYDIYEKQETPRPKQIMKKRQKGYGNSAGALNIKTSTKQANHGSDNSSSSRKPGGACSQTIIQTSSASHSPTLAVPPHNSSNNL